MISKNMMSFMSSKDNDGERVMHSKSDNVEVMVNDKANWVIEKLFQSLISSYEIGLKISMKCRDFIFDCAHLLSYKCHEIIFKHVEL